jgi:ribose/xylose/arabinose/galactoside ABC-type transport system permease subunit
MQVNENVSSPLVGKKPGLDIKKYLSKYTIFIILVLMIVVLSIASPVFLTGRNIVNIFTAEAGRGLLALGVAFCIIARGIDLSLGSVVAVSSVFSAALVQELTYSTLIIPDLVYIPSWIAVLVGIILGTLFGVLNGLLIAYTKIPAFIATLGSMVIARGVALLFTNAYPVPMLRDDFTDIGQGNWILSLPNIVVVFLIFAVIAYILLNWTKFGKNVYAIGGNIDAARAAGIKVERNLVAIYTWSAMCASVAGIMITSRSASGIASLGTGYELDAIDAATVGGVSHTGGIGTIPGVFIGILVLGVINNGLLILGVSPYLQQIIKGIIIVVAVVFDMRKISRKA